VNARAQPRVLVVDDAPILSQGESILESHRREIAVLFADHRGRERHHCRAGRRPLFLEGFVKPVTAYWIVDVDAARAAR
jgi:hypothetical protein